jgi:hypothetical protein
MFFKRNLLIGLMLWAFLGATSAYAGSHAHGHHHHDQVVSPFEKNKQTQSLHCQLKKHAHIDFCPHSTSSKDRSNFPQISVDCGGNTSGAIPGAQFFSHDFAEMNFILPAPHKPENKLVLSKLSPLHRCSDSLDPPPRVI